MAVGAVSEITPRDGGVRATIDAGKLDLDDVVTGDSIAVNGVCLTAIAHTADSFTVDISAETQRCTTGFQAGLAWITILRKRDAFRAAFLASLGATFNTLRFDDLIERTLDDLAAHLDDGVTILVARLK